VWTFSGGTCRASGQSGLTIEQADHMIENVVGMHALPLELRSTSLSTEGSAGTDGDRRTIRGGGASFMAKLARAGGGFIAQADPPEMIGQISFWV